MDSSRESSQSAVEVVAGLSFRASDVRRAPVRQNPPCSIYFKVGSNVALNPRNPQQQSNTGKTRDDGPEESQCISASFVRYCSCSSCCACRQRRLRKLAWQLRSARPHCLFMNSLFVRATVISGHLATGPTTTTPTITTGCRAHG